MKVIFTIAEIDMEWNNNFLQNSELPFRSSLLSARFPFVEASLNLIISCNMDMPYRIFKNNFDHLKFYRLDQYLL